MKKRQSAFGFKLMSLEFKVRDIIRPRGKILKEVGIRPGFTVLDFGCGPGGYILPLAKLIGASGKIYALDLNPAAIMAIKSLVAKKHLNLETILSDGITGLPNGSIDTILLYDVLHHLEKLAEVLGELHRVLKPGGILSVTDHHLREDDITSRVSGTGLFLLSHKGRAHNFFRV